ncbi:MAG TPA: hypothetical protein DDZ81_13390 [Acetobacteraceae bacterium]|nr:hypothetical protein [Acetobacteraceae bacterium]
MPPLNPASCRCGCSSVG